MANVTLDIFQFQMYLHFRARENAETSGNDIMTTIVAGTGRGSKMAPQLFTLHQNYWKDVSPLDPLRLSLRNGHLYYETLMFYPQFN